MKKRPVIKIGFLNEFTNLGLAIIGGGVLIGLVIIATIVFVLVNVYVR